MIHYHGGRHSTWQVAVEIWKRRHALVSFAEPQQIVIAAEVAQSFALDNGAFSVWKQGQQANWPAYYKWVEEWRRHPGFDWAIIPDVIDGDEAANDALLQEWPFGKTAGIPVWHFHESLERLARLAAEWPRVALGSSGQYASVGTLKWWTRMQHIMATVCDGAGKPKVKLHGLRMLRPAICRLGGRLPQRRHDELGRLLPPGIGLGKGAGVDRCVREHAGRGVVGRRSGAGGVVRMKGALTYKDLDQMKRKAAALDEVREFLRERISNAEGLLAVREMVEAAYQEAPCKAG